MQRNKVINCRGHLVSLETPLVMGIINVNDDSFYSPSRVRTPSGVLERAEKMFFEGVDILDLGAMSSRPGSKTSSPTEELSRLVPALKELRKEFPNSIISVDTIHSEVARVVLEEGVHMINDISGGFFDEAMMSVVGRYGVPYVMMHMQGLPENMQVNPHYEDVVMTLLAYFKEQLRLADFYGIKDVLLDPGLGFGKTMDHNYEILKKLEVFHIFDHPILVGLSRKSMIWKVLNNSPEEALNGTTALHMAALLKGTQILRVHDVKEAKETIQLYMKIKPEIVMGTS